MNAKEKLERANLLLETYGCLLTKKQFAIMKDKYQYDLSLQEIANSYRISRAGVLDSINNAYKKLEDYESKLKLIRKKKTILTIIKDRKLKKTIGDIL